MLQVLVFSAMFVAAWYLTIVRPQKQHRQLHEDVTSSLAPGDRILTVGGIYGTVLERMGDELVVELGPGTTTEISRSAVAGVQRGNGLPPRRSMEPEAPQPAVSHSSTNQAEHNLMQHQTPHGNPHGQFYGSTPDPHHVQPVAGTAHQPYAYMNEQPPAPLQPPAAPLHTPFGTGVAPHPNPFALSQHSQIAPQPHSADQHTYRAHVVDHAGPNPGGYGLPPIPSFEPRAWSAPVHPQESSPQQPHHQHFAHPPAPQPMPMQHYAPAVPQPPASLLGPVISTAPQPAQTHPIVQGYPAAPQHVHAQPYPAAPPQPQLHQYTQQMPQQMPAQQIGAPAAQAPAPPAAPARPRSQAPQGMGQSAAVDPALVREFERARQERSQLAGEYQRLVEPMVAVTSTPALPANPHGQSTIHTTIPVENAAPTTAPAQTQHLFVHQPGVPPAQVRSQFPAPAHTPSVELAANPVPRPGLERTSSQNGVPAPFARNAPYSPHLHSEQAAPVAAG